MSRRRFVQVMVGVATAAAVGSTVASIVGLRPTLESEAPPPSREGIAVCHVCSVGCGLLSVTSRGVTFPSRGDPKSSQTSGMACARGTYPPATDWPSTLRTPLRRVSPTTKGSTPVPEHFVEVPWEDALDDLAADLVEAGQVFGPSSRGCILGGNVPLEDAYVAAKLFKGAMASPSIDTVESIHSRATDRSYMEQLGEVAPPVCYDDVGLADLIVVVGEDLANTHPVLYAHVAEAVHSRGAQLVVLDARVTETSLRTRALHLPVKSGGEVALLNAVGHVLVHELEVAPAPGAAEHAHNAMAYGEFLKLYGPVYDPNERVDPEHMATLCDGDDGWIGALGNRDASGLLKSFDVPTITGLEAEDIRQLATLWNRSGNVLTIWSSRLAGAGDDGAAVGTVINLHLLTDQVGRPGAGPFGLHATASGRGTVEAGASPLTLPGAFEGGTGLPSPRLEELWDPLLAGEAARLPPGQGVTDMVARAARGDLPVLILLGGSVSAQIPDRELVEEALTSVYVVCTAAHLGDPDVAFADLVLPAPTWYEREAHLISSERRIARSQPSLVAPEGPRTGLQVLSALGSAMVGGDLFRLSSSGQVMDELRRVTEDAPADLSALPLGDDLTSARGVQWPVATERSASLNGTARRHLGQDGRGAGFPTVSGKAIILPREHPGLKRPASLEYPMTAIVGIDADGWWDGSFTPPEGGLVERSTTVPPAYAELPREDAEALGVAEGGPVLVTSMAGSVPLPLALAREGTAQGHVFIPWHPHEGTSVLVPSGPLDRSGVPPWSSFPVKVERVEGEGEEG